MRYLLLISSVLFLFASNCLANVQNNFTFISQVQEQRFAQLIKELRCLVCQNQNLADSNAPLALDLKREVQEKIRSGSTDEEIKKYLVDHYGEYILFKPPKTNSTFILWLGPFIFLLGGFIILFLSIRRQAKKT